MNVTQRARIIPPHGGELINLIVPAEQANELKAYAGTLPSITLTERNICDLELLSVGGFSPLDRFMGKADYQRVLDEMRLANGQLFPLPVTLAVDDNAPIQIGQDIALRDRHHQILAIMNIEEIYDWNLEEEAQKAYGTLDARHPIVAEMHKWGKRYIAGPLKVLQPVPRYDFKEIRRTPAETRALLEKTGHENVVAFQTRNPMHRVHEELTKRAIAKVDGVLLLHPSVGMTKPGDVDYYTRVRVYKALVENHYEKDRVVLSLLPLAMRMGGPREALLHMIIRRNYGANFFIVGRDHAGPGNDSTGKPFYGPYEAQEIAKQYAEELSMGVLPFEELVYLTDEDRYEEVSQVPAGAKITSLSGTQVRVDYLGKGRLLPDWFTRKEAAEILAQTFPPRNRQGFCLWFTGLSGSGKSTTAEVLTVMLLEHGRQISVLDGDVVRTHLSKGLGFSREDRDTNIRRIGYVASEIARHGGAVICAAISPYIATRNDVRNLVGEGFIEIFVDTPLDICENRDTKGLYAKARSGELKEFTGISDPYEPPINPELTLNTVAHSPEENARIILNYLIEQGYVQP